MNKQARRLKELAQSGASFEAFLQRALKFPRWYGFPKQGSKADYLAFYLENKGK